MQQVRLEDVWSLSDLTFSSATSASDSLQESFAASLTLSSCVLVCCSLCVTACSSCRHPSSSAEMLLSLQARAELNLLEGGCYK